MRLRQIAACDRGILCVRNAVPFPCRIALHRCSVAVDVPRLSVLRGRRAQPVHEPEVPAQIVFESPLREEIRRALRRIPEVDGVLHRRRRAHEVQRIVVKDRIRDECRLHPLHRRLTRELELMAARVELRILALVARGRVTRAPEQRRHRRVGVGPLDENARRMQTVRARGVRRVSGRLHLSPTHTVRVAGDRVVPARRILGG